MFDSEDSSPMWIESHQSLGRHPKTKRLARKLGIVLPTAIGHLHLLWWWALDYAPDGDITKYDAAELADECAWTDDPDTFMTALTEAGFVDVIDGQTVIHDWNDYAGKLIERRSIDRERMREHRAKQKQGGNERASYVTGTLPARSPDVLSTVPNLTVPTGPNQPKEREVSHDTSAQTPITYLSLTQRLKAEANKPAVIADGIRAWYEIDCQDFGRLGSLGKAHGYGELLKIAWDLLPSWNGVDDPLDYITATANGRKTDRRNGHNGHSAEKLPTNHQVAPIDMTQASSVAEIHAEADEVESPAVREFRERRERGRAMQAQKRELVMVAVGSEPSEFGQ